MAKKKNPAKKETERPLVPRTWKVTRTSGDVGLFTAHDLSTWEGSLTFTNRIQITPTDHEVTVIKAIAVGQWIDVELVEPQPSPLITTLES